MKLARKSAPHIRHQDSNRTLMSDVLLLLCVLCGLAFLYYRTRTLVICTTAVVSCVVCESICVLMRGKRPNFNDFSPIITGLIIALTMPATISYYVVVISSIFAIAIVKHPFGGTGHNLFNPAAAGIAFAAICWPEQVFSYPMPLEKLSVLGTYSEKLSSFVFQNSSGQETIVKLYQNPAFVLKVGGIPTNNFTEMLLGNYPGPMGATNILVILACLFYLLFRRTTRWQLPVFFLGSCALWALLFPRAGVNNLQSLYYEMMSGILLFGAVFMITDPVTCPKRDTTLAIYGIFAGIITMAFRYFGGYEESMFFAILLANAFVPLLDFYNESFHRLVRRKHLEIRKSAKISKTKSLD